VNADTGHPITREALDWPVQYWASSARGTSTEFVCARYETRNRPDRRCKTGIRTWSEPCHHIFPDWETARELLDAIAAHIAEAHSEVRAEDLHSEQDDRNTEYERYAYGNPGIRL
jgi:hypothetical protein